MQADIYYKASGTFLEWVSAIGLFKDTPKTVDSIVAIMLSLKRILEQDDQDENNRRDWVLNLDKKSRDEIISSGKNLYVDLEKLVKRCENDVQKKVFLSAANLQKIRACLSSFFYTIFHNALLKSVVENKDSIKETLPTPYRINLSLRIRKFSFYYPKFALLVLLVYVAVVGFLLIPLISEIILYSAATIFANAHAPVVVAKTASVFFSILQFVAAIPPFQIMLYRLQRSGIVHSATYKKTMYVANAILFTFSFSAQLVIRSIEKVCSLFELNYEEIVSFHFVKRLFATIRLNEREKSLAESFPDPDLAKKACDSILNAFIEWALISEIALDALFKDAEHKLAQEAEKVGIDISVLA